MSVTWDVVVELPTELEAELMEFLLEAEGIPTIVEGLAGKACGTIVEQGAYVLLVPHGYWQVARRVLAASALEDEDF